MDTEEKVLFTILIAGMAFIAVGLFYAAKGSREEKKRMDIMHEQCIADGKKEYECYHLLNSGKDTTTVIPVVTPVYMGR